MVNTANVKLYAVKGRHSVNFPSVFVRDSVFPFTVGEPLTARIEGGRVVIEKADPKAAAKKPKGKD